MNELVHTPYAGGRSPFSIGLQPLDLADWIEPDAHLRAHLDEKERLFAASREAVFGEEPDTRTAQAEVLALLADHLPARFPGIYTRDGDHVAIAGTGRTVDLDTGAAPLLTASRLIQEDLVVMRQGPEGYRLVAASLCFPSSWSLAEKFGRPMSQIHAPVPNWEGKMGQRVDRIFQTLKVDRPVWRLNWSLYPDAELHHPESRERPRDWFSGGGSFGGDSSGGGVSGAIVPSAFIRVERQTLRRLPISGDILFTIRIYVDPLAALARHPEGRSLARSLRDQLLALDEAQAAYKALLEHRGRIVAALEAFIAAPETAAIGAG
ncbi:heme-dependent oxidative N-demethylase family protein [Microbaculum sp. FT89]|uniref:heme-dependent oxidative N-demethylase family protein n=1 Tax=Microbaculum sp. FT89 TaxID=3447298 RepID=UPI003F532D67